jgi:peptide chain release factor 1
MYEQIKAQFKLLEEQLSDQAVVSDLKKLQAISKQHADLKEIIQLINELEKLEGNIRQNKEMIANETEPELLAMAKAELEELEAKLITTKQNLDEEMNPADPLDKKDAILEIRAGTGGDESALFAADLFRMYSKYAETQGWKIEIVSSNNIGIGGYKEIIFFIHGKNVYGNLKYEAGIHRVQRVPETEKAGRIHTSAATVVVLPEAEEVDLQINLSDLRIDTFCSSGPGGQSVNTTYSAIRITHLPTGMIVSCQDQKSQHQNKDKAMQVLRSRLLQKQEDERQTAASAQRKEMIGTGDRSEKIRTYNFPQDRITDHRIKTNWHAMDRILDGELQPIIDALKIAAKSEQSNA